MDILLQDIGDGAEVVLEGGDIKGDGTLYNSVYLSLFEGDKFSNAFEKYKSSDDFEKSLDNSITLQNLKNVENKGNEALKWLIAEGVADSIEVSAYGNIDNKIQVDITINEPSGNNQRFGVVWENQRKVLKAI